MYKYLGLIILSAGMALSAAETSYAESTGWITGSKWATTARNLGRKGKIVTAISCKDSGKIGLTFDSVLVKAEIRNNPQKTKWWWAGGRARVKRAGRRLAKRGYKLARQRTYKFLHKNSRL